MTEPDVCGLVMWWATHGISYEGLLADDFVYTSSTQILDKEALLEWMRITDALEAVRILAILVGPHHATAFFEAKDPVTALEHRTAWLLAHRDGLVTSATAVSVVLSRP